MLTERQELPIKVAGVVSTTDIARAVIGLLLLATAAPAGSAAQVAPASGVPWARYAVEVTRLYRLGGDRPVWHDGTGISTSGRAALDALLRADEHGLDPGDYAAATLDSMAEGSTWARLGPIDRDRFDALLSVELIRFLDDLQFGRLHPPMLDRTGADSGIDLAIAIRNAIVGHSVAQLPSAMAPQLAQYRNLQLLLRRYRELARDSSLPPLARHQSVLPGDTYADAPTLRRRLAALGDLDPGRAAELTSSYNLWDAEGVRRYQARHGYSSTGILDSATIAELNLSLTWRVRQIELALERLRWLPAIGGQRFLVVNIPAFQLFAFDSAGGTGAPALSMRVIVGNALDTRTPVLFERMRYIEFRPSWTIPPSITVKEILPQLREDPGYFQQQEIQIIAPGGRVIDSAPDAGIIQRLKQGVLQLRQSPGPHNPLGLVKFVFPNAEWVYLHGTPRSDLFGRTRRDFSHGCIRVEDPTTLAAWVLRDRPEWTRPAIGKAQQGSRTIRVPLTRPMPVVVWYTTAVAAPDGKAWFYPDLYGHDRTLDQALRALGAIS